MTVGAQPRCTGGRGGENAGGVQVWRGEGEKDEVNLSGSALLLYCSTPADKHDTILQITGYHANLEWSIAIRLDWFPGQSKETSDVVRVILRTGTEQNRDGQRGKRRSK